MKDHTMQLSIISQDKVLKYENIVDVVANTQQGQQHLTRSNWDVSDIKRGRVQFLMKRHWSDSLETLSVYVDDGIAYVENRTLNIVANLREH